MKFTHTRLSAGQKLGALAAAGAAIAAAVLFLVSAASANAAESIAIDLDISGNTATTLGTREDCFEVSAGDSTQLDITITNVPEMQAFTYKLGYNQTAITVTGKDNAGLLTTAPSYSELDLSEAVPDNDGLFEVDIANLMGTSTSGSGFLTRLTVAVAPGATPGGYALSLFEAQSGDEQNEYWTAPTFGARLAVGVTCESLPTPNVQGDVDCANEVNAVDALKILRHVAGLSVSQTEPCQDIGTGDPLQGDVDCASGVTAVDALKILRHVAGLPVTQTEPCADIGT